MNEKLVQATLLMVQALRENPTPLKREILWVLTNIDGLLLTRNFNDSDKTAMLSMYNEVDDMFSEVKKEGE